MSILPAKLRRRRTDGKWICFFLRGTGFDCTHGNGLPGSWTKSISFTGQQAGITTSDAFNKGRILDIQPDRILKALDEGNVVIVAGFQGITDHGDITTLGRGGSDTTAVAIAGAIHADVCEIYTDVEGVYTSDPRLVPGAMKMKEITYGEMLEMAKLGAGVMQPRAVEMGSRFNVPIHVRSIISEMKVL